MFRLASVLVHWLCQCLQPCSKMHLPKSNACIYTKAQQVQIWRFQTRIYSKVVSLACHLFGLSFCTFTCICAYRRQQRLELVQSAGRRRHMMQLKRSLPCLHQDSVLTANADSAELCSPRCANLCLAMYCAVLRYFTWCCVVVAVLFCAPWCAVCCAIHTVL